MKSLIIDRPDLQSQSQRLIFGGLTLIFWLFYFYLWLPLLTLAAWMLGLITITTSLISVDGYIHLRNTLFTYLVVIIVINSIYLLWARMNFQKFKNVERRQARPQVDLDKIAEDVNFPANLRYLQNTKSVLVAHDKDGRIISAVPYNKLHLKI